MLGLYIYKHGNRKNITEKIMTFSFFRYTSEVKMVLHITLVLVLVSAMIVDSAISQPPYVQLRSECFRKDFSRVDFSKKLAKFFKPISGLKEREEIGRT